jgi:putative ABC transport system ATP-binding protein
MRKTYQGNISYENQLLQSFNQEQLAKLRATQLSIVFQDLRLFPDQTVEENLLIKHHLHPFIMKIK